MDGTRSPRILFPGSLYYLFTNVLDFFFILISYSNLLYICSRSWSLKFSLFFQAQVDVAEKTKEGYQFKVPSKDLKQSAQDDPKQSEKKYILTNIDLLWSGIKLQSTKNHYNALLHLHVGIVGGILRWYRDNGKS